MTWLGAGQCGRAGYCGRNPGANQPRERVLLRGGWSDANCPNCAQVVPFPWATCAFCTGRNQAGLNDGNQINETTGKIREKLMEP